MLAGTHIGPARAALAPRGTLGGLAAACASPLGAAAGIALAGGGVAARSAPVIARGATHALGVAVEGCPSASPAQLRGAPGGVLLAIGLAPGVPAWLAGGAALDGRPAPAARTPAGVAPSMEAPLASLPGDAPASCRISPAVELPCGPGGRVPGPRRGAPFFCAACAQTPLRLGRVPGAPRTQSLCEAFVGAGTGAPVLALPGLRLANALDAGGATPGPAGAVGDSPLLVAGRAQAAIGFGRGLAAFRAQPLGNALGGRAPEPFTVASSSHFRVSVCHCGIPPTGFGRKAGRGRAAPLRRTPRDRPSTGFRRRCAVRYTR